MYPVGLNGKDVITYRYSRDVARFPFTTTRLAANPMDTLKSVIGQMIRISGTHLSNGADGLDNAVCALRRITHLTRPVCRAQNSMDNALKINSSDYRVRCLESTLLFSIIGTFVMSTHSPSKCTLAALFRITRFLQISCSLQSAESVAIWSAFMAGRAYQLLGSGISHFQRHYDESLDVIE